MTSKNTLDQYRFYCSLLTAHCSLYESIMPSDPLIIAGRRFRSRLMVGTGKFPSAAALKAALDAAGAEIVTVALRRVDLGQPAGDSILSVLDPEKYLILPNTSGARTADEAVRLAKMARAMGLPPWVKLELTPEPKYLLPDPVETLKAAEILIKEGFVVLPYIQADPVLAKRLEEMGDRHGHAPGGAHRQQPGGPDPGHDPHHH